MELFFVPDIFSDNLTLTEEESKHIIRVLRFNSKDIIYLTDGNGTLCEAEIVDANPTSCEVKIIKRQKEFGKRNYYLHIAIAPTKNTERFEWFLEKATEIGIDEITPLICEHSERKEIKRERLNKVMVSAMKQSLKTYLPKLNTPVKFKDLIQHSNESQKFICHCDSEKNSNLKNLYSKEKDVLLLIGPEGDFSKEEIRLAIEKKFKVITLGESRLRTETAGVHVCSLISFLSDE